jgi:hypothetical protein
LSHGVVFGVDEEYALGGQVLKIGVVVEEEERMAQVYCVDLP